MTSSTLTPDVFQQHLRAEAELIVDVLADCDPDALVPTCPGWTVTDLIEHLGGTHGWAARIVETGDGPKQPRPQREPAEDLVRWYAARARELADVLATTDPDRAAWNFGPGEQVAGFWSRRQAHEALVHRVDLQLAAGIPANDRAVDPRLAADGMAEVFTVMTPRLVSRGLGVPDLVASVVLRTTDAEEVAWLLEPRRGEAPAAKPAAGAAAATDSLRARDASGADEPASAEHQLSTNPAGNATENGTTGPAAGNTAGTAAGGATEPAAEIAGPAGALYLRLWKRPGGPVTVTGDQDVAERYLASPLTP